MVVEPFEADFSFVAVAINEFWPVDVVVVLEVVVLVCK